MKTILKLFFFAFLLSFSAYAQPTLNMTVSTTSGCVDGTMTIDITNGTPPYQYHVTSRNYNYQSGDVSITHIELTGLPHGDYYVSVYDNEGVYYGNGQREHIASAFDLSYTRTPVTCNDNGTIKVTPTGGTAPYSYAWSTGETTAQLSNLSSDVYFLTVTDANGCKANSDSLYIEQNTFQLYTETTPYTCHQPGSATVLTYNGDPSTYTYYWKTTPLQTTQTASGLVAGNYEVIVTDAQGCMNKTVASVWEENAFSLNVTTTAADCEQSNGDVKVVPSGGTTPYTYSWSNGATSAHLSNIKGDTYYSLVVTDIDGCTSTSGVYINKKSPLQVAFTTTPSVCQGKGGSATAIVSNGTAPYSYLWYNLPSTTETINNVAAYYYYLKVKDANGCVYNGTTNVTEQSNCKSTISGTVFYDMNSNCLQNNGEIGVSYAAVKYANNRWAYTDQYGNYTIDVYPGTYTLSPNLNSNWTTTCSNINVNVTSGGNSYPNNNLYISPTTLISDASINLYATPQRPGFTRPVELYINNYGTQIENATVTYTFSEGWEFAYSSPMPDAYDAATKTATWHKNSFGPWSYESIIVYMRVPLSTNLGDILTANASITLGNVDDNPNNNTASVQTVTTNSYDPNDIQVSPQGTGSDGFISEQLADLTYRVRFQNTGTDVAYNVSVKSKIDANVEDYTISIVDVSHEVKASIKNDSLFFEFENINLADSTSNEKESHGYVIYRVNKKSDLAPLTQIFNKADIYFDYNVPVETNQVKNTIAIGTSNHDIANTNEAVTVYPNPCRDRAQLAITLEESSDVSIQLYSANGQQISILDNVAYGAGQQVIDLNLASFNIKAGLYIVKVVANDKVYTKSIIINK